MTIAELDQIRTEQPLSTRGDQHAGLGAGRRVAPPRRRRASCCDRRFPSRTIDGRTGAVVLRRLRRGARHAARRSVPNSAKPESESDPPQAARPAASTRQGRNGGRERACAQHAAAALDAKRRCSDFGPRSCSVGPSGPPGPPGPPAPAPAPRPAAHFPFTAQHLIISSALPGDEPHRHLLARRSIPVIGDLAVDDTGRWSTPAPYIVTISPLTGREHRQFDTLAELRASPDQRTREAVRSARRAAFLRARQHVAVIGRVSAR